MLWNVKNLTESTFEFWIHQSLFLRHSFKTGGGFFDVIANAAAMQNLIS